MAFRYIARSLATRFVQATAVSTRLFSSVSRQPNVYQAYKFAPAYGQIRSLSSTQTNLNAYRDLETFLQKEIQSEKSLQKNAAKLTTISNFQVATAGPEVTLTQQKGSDKVTVKFNVTNTVNADESDQEAETTGTDQEQANPTGLKSRPSFTVDINRGGQTLSFLCSFLPDDYAGSRALDGEQGEENTSAALTEDFQIDEFTIHDGEWDETVYSSDCSVIDGELYDKLLNLLEEYGIGEEFANQLAEFSTSYEHQQYIGLLEKLQQFVKK